MSMRIQNKKDFRINIKHYSSINNQQQKTKRVILTSSLIYPHKQNLPVQQNQLNISSIVDPQKLSNFHKLCKKSLVLYNRNLQFYKLNESKLLRIIQKEIQQKNYFHQKSMLNFFIKKQLFHGISQATYIKLEQQLLILNKFLEDLYEKKKMKQICIISQNIKEEEQIISEKISGDVLQSLNANLQVSNFKVGTDFIQEYQNICRKFGITQINLRPQIQIKNHLQDNSGDLKNYLQLKQKSKNQHFNFIKRKNL